MILSNTFKLRNADADAADTMQSQCSASDPAVVASALSPANRVDAACQGQVWIGEVDGLGFDADQQNLRHRYPCLASPGSPAVLGLEQLETTGKHRDAATADMRADAGVHGGASGEQRAGPAHVLALQNAKPHSLAAQRRE